MNLSHKQIINTVTSLAALGNIEEWVEKRDNSRPVCSQNFIALLVIYDHVSLYVILIEGKSISSPNLLKLYTFHLKQ